MNYLTQDIYEEKRFIWLTAGSRAWRLHGLSSGEGPMENGRWQWQ